ncbi:MAG: glycosyltransferase family A protein [Methylacidiphilales bacterium]|nr:glycosyltransferase family A protein [Candidatus Methylacidiphilales bacterium]
MQSDLNILVDTNNKAHRLFSIFITTFNREQLVIRALDSAYAQQERDCHIVVIDDGSSDDTTNSLMQWSKYHLTMPITILALSKNSGKPSAWNSSLPFLHSTFTVALDSDDELLPDALTIFKQQWLTIKHPEHYAAVEGLAFLNNLTQLSTPKYPEDPLDSNWLSLSFQYNLWGGDCRRSYRTEVLKEFPFTLFSNEKSAKDSMITYRMSHLYKVRFFNIPVQIIHQQPHSLSTQGKLRRITSPHSFRLCYLELITVHQKYLSCREYIKQYLDYIVYSLHGEVSIVKQIRDTRTPAIYCVLFPFAYLMYRVQKYKFAMIN